MKDAHYSTLYESPIGNIRLSSNGSFLTELVFLMKNEKPSFPRTAEVHADSIFRKTKKWLDAYFEGKQPDIKIPLCKIGSDFQKKVWENLTKIPYGKVVTYGEISKAIGCNSAQAVGGAVGRNPISIIVPCHRVIASGGHIGDYAFGTDIKAKLLELEGVFLPFSH